MDPPKNKLTLCSGTEYNVVMWLLSELLCRYCELYSYFYFPTSHFLCCIPQKNFIHMISGLTQYIPPSSKIISIDLKRYYEPESLSRDIIKLHLL